MHVKWGESIVKLTWQKRTTLPPLSLITSVHGFCFYHFFAESPSLKERSE